MPICHTPPDTPHKHAHIEIERHTARCQQASHIVPTGGAGHRAGQAGPRPGHVNGASRARRCGVVGAQVVARRVPEPVLVGVKGGGVRGGCGEGGARGRGGWGEGAARWRGVACMEVTDDSVVQII